MLRKIGIFALMSAVCILGLASSASADLPQPDGPPDKGYHSWCYEPGFTLSATADASMTWLRTQTNVKTVFHSPCQSKTDVRWTQKGIPGAYGSAECKMRNSAGQCDRYVVTLNKSIIDASKHPDSQRRKTTCHELGHTVGVRHYFGSDRPGSDTTNSCLRSGEVPTANQTWHTRYGAHHRTTHINPWFG